jgi:hypothetical protein
VLKRKTRGVIGAWGNCISGGSPKRRPSKGLATESLELPGVSSSVSMGWARYLRQGWWWEGWK